MENIIDVGEFVKTRKPRKAKQPKGTGRAVYLISLAVILGLIVLSISVFTGVRAMANWGATHKFVKQQVISLSIDWPYRVEEIKPQVLAPIEKQLNVPEMSTDIERYICDKFGVMDCKTALAVAKAESGMNCNAFNVNSNGSVDFSIFQLNSVHLKKGGEWTLENMANCYKNVDLAYEMWKEQGFQPWVAFTSGGYLAKL